MKSSILSLAIVGLIASVPLLLSSCQDEELGYTAEQIAYRTNFEKSFGKIKDIPTFDLSSYNLARMGLVGGPVGSVSRSLTRTSGLPTGSGISSDFGWYSVEDQTLEWLDENLRESVDNRSKGNPFTLMNTEGNDFLLIPIYQGQAGMSWDLHIVAQTEGGVETDYNIWTKSQGLQYKERVLSSHTKPDNFVSLSYTTPKNHENYPRIQFGSIGDGVTPFYLRIQSSGTYSRMRI